jgi:hypothetical protein
MGVKVRLLSLSFSFIHIPYSLQVPHDETRRLSLSFETFSVLEFDASIVTGTNDNGNNLHVRTFNVHTTTTTPHRHSPL